MTQNNKQNEPEDYVVMLTLAEAQMYGLAKCKHCGGPENNHFSHGKRVNAHMDCPGWELSFRAGVPAEYMVQLWMTQAKEAVRAEHIPELERDGSAYDRGFTNGITRALRAIHRLTTATAAQRGRAAARDAGDQNKPTGLVHKAMFEQVRRERDKAIERAKQAESVRDAHFNNLLTAERERDEALAELHEANERRLEGLAERDSIRAQLAKQTDRFGTVATDLREQLAKAAVVVEAARAHAEEVEAPADASCPLDTLDKLVAAVHALDATSPQPEQAGAVELGRCPECDHEGPLNEKCKNCAACGMSPSDYGRLPADVERAEHASSMHKITLKFKELDTREQSRLLGQLLEEYIYNIAVREVQNALRHAKRE